MKKTKILIVEDEVLVAKDIQVQLQDLGYEVCDIADSAKTALLSSQLYQPDLVLMDINIKGDLDGIQVAKRIQELLNVPIIYLTDMADDETFERAKKTGPHRFLNKPVTEITLKRDIELAINNHGIWNKSLSHEAIFVKDGRSNFRKRLDQNDILFLEASGSYCLIHTSTGIERQANSMSEVVKLLDPKMFMKVHRSFVINMKIIEGYEGNEVTIEGKKVPISRSFSKAFRRRIKES